ncbi:hypothetical protein COLO4_27966 [Corchorus olitorius]|uniref:Son of sevenless n=1 Tax=Corchorus olitorius TaxID=93759 RepID=A0A1R3HNB9_9ROSI|nr:hypothetical protein COLO4_27966 [Corchorus olitorius]
MEITSVTSPRLRLDHHLEKEGSKGDNGETFELESSQNVSDHSYQFHSMNALDILRETVRILRYNLYSFMIIAALLLCPLSAVLMSNLLVDHSIVKRLTVRLLLVAKTSGLPLRPFIKQSCQRFAEAAISSAMCFPLFITLSLLSKAAVVYCVDCTYSRKSADFSKFFVIIQKLWRRLVSTYVWMCMVIVGCVTTFFVFLVAACSLLSVMGVTPDLIAYAVIVMGLVFSVVFAYAIVVCNIGIVICVLEEVSGPQALLRAGILIKGQTQVGLLIYLGSTIGLAFVEGLFEHRVKTLSYGDGSSRIWEGPLLVIMYSFVALVDSMMSAVFYFSCRSYSMEASEGECQSMLETITVSAESLGVQ